MYHKKPNPIAESGVKHQKSINQSTKFFCMIDFRSLIILHQIKGTALINITYHKIQGYIKLPTQNLKYFWFRN